MTRTTKRLLGTAIGAAAMALSAASASADTVACSGDTCWHVKEKYEYPPTAGIVVHEDNWKWRDEDHDKYRWREHEGRGYWRDGAWITF